MGGKLSFSRHSPGGDLTDDDGVDPSTLSLTDQEREVIVSTWKLLKETSDPDFAEEELGVRIFLRIFELTPEVREAFPQFAEMGDRQAMRRNVVFRCHGRRFVRAVLSVVDNLDSLDVIAIPNLDLLGRKHRDFHGFRPEYLRTYEAAMEDVWSEALGRKFERRPWRKVFRLITSAVLQGYEQPSSRTCTPPVATSSASSSTDKATPEMPNSNANGSLPCDNLRSDGKLALVSS